MSNTGALTAMLGADSTAACEHAMATGNKADYKKCLNYDYPSTLDHDTDFYRDSKHRKSRLYRMGDSTIPIEVVV